MKKGISVICALLFILSGCTITKNIVLSDLQLDCQEEAVDSDQFYREIGVASMPVQFSNLAYDKAINNARQSLINRVANCSNSSLKAKIGSTDVVCSRYSTDNKGTVWAFVTIQIAKKDIVIERKEVSDGNE